MTIKEYWKKEFTIGDNYIVISDGVNRYQYALVAIFTHKGTKRREVTDEEVGRMYGTIKELLIKNEIRQKIEEIASEMLAVIKKQG